MRIDRFLWNIRYFKSRSQSTDACKKGKIKLNNKIIKPSREISIGDYVLSGGELAAAVLVDAVIRLIPGVLNNETSALTASFQDNLLAPPVYTRPSNYNGWKVPEILTSGNLKAIEKWRHEKSIEQTTKRRPDLLK